MDRLIALVIFLMLPLASQAASTVVYPTFTGLSQATVAGQTVTAAKTGATVAANGVINFPYAGGLFGGLGSQQSQAVANAITARAPVTQSLAKQVAVGALRAAPGLLLTAWALDFGLQYANTQWTKTTSTPNPAAPPGYHYYGVGLGWGYPTGPCIPGGSCPCSTWNAGKAATGVGNPNAWPEDPTAYYCRVGNTDVWPPTQANSPATESDFSNLGNQGRDLTQAELQQMLANGYAVPIGNPETQIQNAPLSVPIIDFDVVIGQNGGINYIPKDLTRLETNPVTGEKSMPMVQVEPAPNAGVRLTPYSVPYTAQGVPATDAQGNPLPKQASNVDPCTVDPSRVGCAQLGSLDNTIPSPDTKNISLTPDTPWGGAGQCPQPVNVTLMGQVIPFKFDGACQFFQMINPVVLAAAWIGAIFLLVGGVKES